MTFRAVGFGNYAYIVDEDTGGELFKDQGYTLQQLEEKQATPNTRVNLPKPSVKTIGNG